MKIGKNVEVFINRELWNNTYVVFDNQDCVIIDISRNSTQVDEFVKRNKLNVLGIILTHGHYDHIGYGFEFADKYDCQIFINEKEKDVLLKYHLADKFNIDFHVNEKKISYFNEPIFQIGNFKFDVQTFPGHTIGSTILQYDDYIFTGDVVFYDSIGRSDLPTSSNEQMRESLKKFTKVYTNNNDWILPGHGKIGKLEEIKKQNRYLKL